MNVALNGPPGPVPAGPNTQNFDTHGVGAAERTNDLRISPNNGMPPAAAKKSLIQRFMTWVADKFNMATSFAAHLTGKKPSEPLSLLEGGDRHRPERHGIRDFAPMIETQPHVPQSRAAIKEMNAERTPLDEKVKDLLVESPELSEHLEMAAATGFTLEGTEDGFKAHAPKLAPVQLPSNKVVENPDDGIAGFLAGMLTARMKDEIGLPQHEDSVLSETGTGPIRADNTRSEQLSVGVIDDDKRTVEGDLETDGGSVAGDDLDALADAGIEQFYGDVQKRIDDGPAEQEIERDLGLNRR